MAGRSVAALLPGQGSGECPAEWLRYPAAPVSSRRSGVTVIALALPGPVPARFYAFELFQRESELRIQAAAPEILRSKVNRNDERLNMTTPQKFVQGRVEERLTMGQAKNWLRLVKNLAVTWYITSLLRMGNMYHDVR